MSGYAGTFLPLIVLILIMYLLLIRPQKKKEKQVNAMRAGIQVGDEIITIGGICGKVVKTKPESLVIQVGADKVKFEIMRWAVSRVVEEGKKKSAKGREEAFEEETEVKRKPKRMKKAAPVEEEPVVEETAAVEAPAAEEAVVEEAPAEEAAPAEEK